MRLSFHQRILLILICLGAVPTAVAILGWALTIRSTTPGGGAAPGDGGRRASGRVLLQTLDSTRLDAGASARRSPTHAAKLNSASAGSSGSRPSAATTTPAWGSWSAARRGGAPVRLGAAGRPPLAPAEPADRRAGRLDRLTSGGRSRCRPTGRGGARRSSPRCARRSARWRPRWSRPRRASSRPSGSAPSAKWPAASRTR